MSIDFLKLPALQIVQPIGVFYAVVIKANILKNITYVDTFRVSDTSRKKLYELKGHQRKQKARRLREIGAFINTVEATFPNTIILAANYDKDSGNLIEDKIDKKLKWRFEPDEKSPGTGTLIIPTDHQLAAIVDGQHRLEGFEHCSTHKEMSMLCSVFLDLPNPIQAFIFATINSNQKRVDKSLSYELYGYNLNKEEKHSWTPEKLAVYFSRMLNVDEESSLKRHIIIAAQDNLTPTLSAEYKSVEWNISTATFVDGILKLYSGNPKRDRDEMLKFSIRKRHRKLLVNFRDKTPLRQYFVEQKDKLLYAFIRNFFNAANEIFWQEFSKQSYIFKTVGVQALFDVLKNKEICLKAIEDKDISKEYFIEKLDSCKEIDFTDNFFQASGTGKGRISNCLQLCLGIKGIDKTKEIDRADYRRLTGVN